jgi:hypothetical protein
MPGHRYGFKISTNKILGYASTTAHSTPPLLEVELFRGKSGRFNSIAFDALSYKLYLDRKRLGMSRMFF